MLDAPVAQYISTYATHWYYVSEAVLPFVRPWKLNHGHFSQGVHTGNATTDAKTGNLMGRSYVRSNVTRLSEFASQSNAAGLDFIVVRSP